MISRSTRSPASRYLRWARDGAIILGVTLALLAVSEATLRAFFPQHLTATPIEAEHLSQWDELLGIRYVPGARWRFRDPEYTAEYAINEHGFRDANNYTARKREGTTRVLVLGDSFTFGQGVEYEDVWTTMVERRLRELGRSDIEIMNAGIQGTDQRSQLILLKELAQDFEIDVVVVAFLINDLYSNLPYEPTEDGAAEAHASTELTDTVEEAGDSWSQMRERIYTSGGWLQRLHLPTLARRMVISSDAAYNALYLAAPDRGSFLRVPLPDYPREKLAITERLFQQIHEYCRENGQELIVISIPQQFQVLYYDRAQMDESIDVALYAGHFTRFAEHHGFAWIPTIHDFARARSRQGPLFYRLDGHLTPDGNSIVADVFLRKVVPLLDATGRPASGMEPAHSDE
jgi:lysophospholipase L1-like esterase